MKLDNIFQHRFVSILMLLTIILSLAAIVQTPRLEAQLPIPPGVPRGDVYIAENHGGRYTDPYNCNAFIPGAMVCYGYSQVGGNYLYYFNTTSGEWIPWVAASSPEYSPDFTKVRIYLRKGVTWSDGVPYTADDLVFQINLLKTNSRLSWHATFRDWVKDIRKIDDYTVEIELTKANPRFHYWLTAQLGIALIPKHIWEKVEDPLTFKFYPPVVLGPAVLKDVDPEGYWFLWERNEDWWATKLYGMKIGPKYVLFIHYGPDEKEVAAMKRGELESVRTWLPEVFEIAFKDPEMVKYMGGFYGAGAPYAWPYDACMKGPVFNVLRYPYNITEVRMALTHAVDVREIVDAFTGIDGSKPVLSPLPVIPRPKTVEVYFKPLEPELVKLGYDPEVGWWKYDPAKAEELLKSVGFKKGSDGKWYLPTGEKWVVKIMTFAEVELESQRLAYLTAEQWRRFGIDVEVEPIEWAVFSPRLMAGEFDVVTYFPGCNFLPTDLGDIIVRWHSRYCDPNNPGLGWLYYSNFACYKFPEREQLDKILDELTLTHPEDPKAIELAKQALLIWAKQRPWPQYFPVPFYTINYRYAWTGFPEYPAKYYSDPVYWWPHFIFVLLSVRPTGNAEYKEAYTGPVILRPPVEKPAVTPTPAFVTVTVTATVASPTTVTATVTAAAATVISSTTVTVPTTVISTVVSTSPTTVLSTVMRTETTTVTVTDWTTTIVLAIVLLIIGFAIGYIVKRR